MVLKPVVNLEINYQPQLVTGAGFLNYQQYVSCGWLVFCVSIQMSLRFIPFSFFFNRLPENVGAGPRMHGEGGNWVTRKPSLGFC